MKIIQGDVILKKVDSIPADAIELQTKILQRSEVTGHHHYFLGNAAVKLYESAPKPTITMPKTITPDTGKFIFVSEDTIMYHGVPSKEGHQPLTSTGDHLPLLIPPGNYQVVITREYDYDANEIRKVAD
jgi:hypothetical protein